MREMKDSGIEWIGKIPHCWNTSKLKYLGQYINGYAFKPEEWGSKGVPIIRIQDLTGSNDNPNYFEGQIDKKYGVENGDILISWAATLDAFIWNKGNGWLNQHIFKAVPNRRIIDYDFFFWMIKESMKNMNNDNKHGIFMQHVTLSVFNNFTIPMPPLAEQHRIAAFLDRKCAEIDAVLEKTRASIEEYKKLKQAVITQAVTKGVRGDRPMKDSGIEWIGDIPAGVPISRVGLHFDIVLGKMLCSAPVDDNYTLESYYCAADVHFEGLSNGEKKKMWFSPDEKEQYCVKNGDLLVVEGGAGAGGCAIAVSTDVPIYIQNSIMIVRSKGISNIRYLRYLLECLVKKGYIDVVCNKATIPHFTKDKLANVPFIVFSQSEQEEIAEYLNEKCAGIDALIAKKQQYLTEIENYKKSLIYEYVTGKKEVV